MQEVDAILCRFGADSATYYSTENVELTEQCRQAGLKMLTTTVRHLGTIKSQQFLQQLRHYLNDKVDLFSILSQQISFNPTKDSGLRLSNSRIFWLKKSLSPQEICLLFGFRNSLLNSISKKANAP